MSRPSNLEFAFCAIAYASLLLTSTSVRGQTSTCPQQILDPQGGWYGTAGPGEPSVRYDHIHTAIQEPYAVYGMPDEFCNDHTVFPCGAAYIFQQIAGEWTQVARLRPPELFLYNEFGWSVAIDGDLVVIGAPALYCPGTSGNDAPTGPGSVYIYRRDAQGNWNYEARLTAPTTPSDYDAFGSGVAVSAAGNYVLIGSPGKRYCDSVGPEPRAVYSYYHVNGSWQLEDTLTHSASPGFGATLRLEEPHLAVASDTFAAGTSGTYMFKHLGTSWIPNTSILSNEATPLIDLDGDRLLVCAQTYRYNGSTWQFEAVVKSPGATSCSPYTESVALHGNLAVTGHVEAFSFQNGSWAPAETLGGFDPAIFMSYLAPTASGSGVLLGPYFYDLQVEDCNVNHVDDRCENIGSADCNGNGIKDVCDIFYGTSTDCDHNGVPDECDPDCNHNGYPDACDILNGVSTDCNHNGIPDECDPLIDCNSNSVSDACEVQDGTSPDCNANGIPDECDIANGTVNDCNNDGIPDGCNHATDCNGNGLFDACDIVNGSSSDCDGNGIPDECEQDTMDCNSNGVPDQCDIAAGTLTDANGDGFADECGFGFSYALQPAPDDAQGPRYIAFVVPYMSQIAAIRVRLASLAHPNPPNAVGIAEPSYAGFEDRVRWVASPVYFTESNAPPAWGYAWQLTCAPYYTGWNGSPSGQIIYVSGPEILPSSYYDVQFVGQSCQGVERNCVNVSAPLRVHTRRWGDVAPPFQTPSPAPLTQPDIKDVTAILNKMKEIPGSLGVTRTDLFGNAPNHRVDISDVSSAVDAFKGLAFPFAGPSNCP
ncbi:MAG: hypothetical protein HY287_10630 [Planctomycetes bacterium]|nr:hypothetical protein [Planctomycetota bacterium]MBI3834773.1 hypothetical protein [Planctomycetota bacterium]